MSPRCRASPHPVVTSDCALARAPENSSLRAIDDIFSDLSKSAFRRRFRLASRERAYLAQKGLPTVLEHGRDFVLKRLAPSEPRNDGKQTPFRGHPVFVAQHATATCCRGCLAKWHGISSGRALDEAEVTHVLTVLDRWLEDQMQQR